MAKCQASKHEIISWLAIILKMCRPYFFCQNRSQCACSDILSIDRLPRGIIAAGHGCTCVCKYTIKVNPPERGQLAINVTCTQKKKNSSCPIRSSTIILLGMTDMLGKENCNLLLHDFPIVLFLVDMPPLHTTADCLIVCKTSPEHISTKSGTWQHQACLQPCLQPARWTLTFAAATVTIMVTARS